MTKITLSGICAATLALAMMGCYKGTDTKASGGTGTETDTTTEADPTSSTGDTGSTGGTTDAPTTEPADSTGGTTDASTTEPADSTTSTTDTTSTSSTTDTTGELAVCGNGKVENGEGCDELPCAEEDGVCNAQTGLCSQNFRKKCLTDIPPTQGEADRCSTKCELLEAPGASSTGGGAVDDPDPAQESHQEAPTGFLKRFFGG